MFLKYAALIEVKKENTRIEDLKGKAAKYFVNLSSQPIKAFIKNLFINY